MRDFSNKIQVRVSPSLQAAYPAIQVSGLIVELPEDGSANWCRAKELLEDRVQASLDEIELDQLANHHVVGVWREAYRSMGLKSSKYRSSVEQLVRRSVKDTLGSIGIPLADIYNQVSVAALAPMGAYDIDRLEDAPIELRYCEPNEDHFDPLGGQSEKFPLLQNVAVYAQGAHVLCWAINHRDAESTALAKETRRALILSEGIDDATSQNAANAVRLLGDTLSSLGIKCQQI